MQGVFPGQIPEHVQRVYHLAAQAVESFNEVEGVRCHEVVRAVHRLIAGVDPALAEQVQVVDGRYSAVDHSWLAFGQDWVVDCYSVARWPMVQVLDVGTLAVVRQFWRTEPRTDIDEAAIAALLLDPHDGDDCGACEDDGRGFCAHCNMPISESISGTVCAVLAGVEPPDEDRGFVCDLCDQRRPYSKKAGEASGRQSDGQDVDLIWCTTCQARGGRP